MSGRRPASSRRGAAEDPSRRHAVPPPPGLTLAVPVLAVLLMGAGGLVSPDTLFAQPAGDSCVRCHWTLETEVLTRPALQHQRSVHGQAGISCAGCHGGDGGAETERVAHEGMTTRPSPRRIPLLCARCHSNAGFMKRYNPNIRVDQLDRYRTSVHGQRLLELGDTAVATCVDCHSAHHILQPSAEQSTVHPRNVPGTCGECHGDPDHMAPYDIPTDQLELYRESIHWESLTQRGDLSAPVCNDCHGNHGAVPPGYASVGRVCAECHVRTADYFALSPHDTAFTRLQVPGCSACHQNHHITRPGDEMLGIGGRGVCGGSGCHAPDGEDAGEITAMRGLIDSLRTALDRADSLLTAAEQAGMPVEEAQFELQQGQDALVSARAASHTTSLDTVRARVDTGLVIAADVTARGHTAFDDLAFRRTGLAVSAFVILLLIVGLLLKIRQTDAAAEVNA